MNIIKYICKKFKCNSSCVLDEDEKYNKLILYVKVKYNLSDNEIQIMESIVKNKNKNI